MIILDTNVISELMRSAPTRAVTRWVARQPAATLFTTAVTEAEVMLGIALLPEGRKKIALADAARHMFAEDLTGRVLPFDGEAARGFAEVVATRRRIGRPIAHADAEIAAIARAHGAVLSTRNAVDFEHCEIRVVNPWSADQH